MKTTDPKIRKLLTFVTGLLLFIVILNAVFSFFRFPFLNVSPLEAIPNRSAIFLELYTELDSLPFHLALATAPENQIQQQIKEDHHTLLKLIGDNSMLDKKLRTIISPQFAGNKKIEFLYVFDFRGKALKTFLNNIPEHYKVKDFNFLGYHYQSVKISKQQSISFFKFRNLLLVSKSNVLIEKSIKQLENYQENLCFNADFKIVFKPESSRNQATAYINFNYISDLFSSFLKAENQNLLEIFPQFLGWLRVEVNHFSTLDFNGQYIGNQGIKNTGSLKNIIKNSLFKVIPDNAGILLVQSGKPEASSNENEIYKQYVFPWLKNEWAFTIMNPHSSADRLLLLKADDPNKAKDHLQKYGEAFGELISSSYQTFPLHQLVGQQLLNPYIKRLQLNFGNPFYTIIDDVIIFAANRQSLELLIDKHIVGQTIMTNEGFLAFINGISETAEGLIYYDEKSLFRLLQKIIDENEYLTFDKNSDFAKDRVGGFEFFSNEEKRLFRSRFKKVAQLENRTNIVWKVSLPNPISKSPVPLWNPDNDRFEIAVQDDLHILYLINDSGEVLWKRALKEPILSEIHQIDYQKNGSAQLLFNTASYIYLLDRNGSDIGNYPLFLQSKASNGITVIDFKQNRDYQLFLACENGHAYGFTKEGNPIFGWNPSLKVGKVLHPFKHLQNDQLDFISILNTEGVLTTLNSLGLTAFPGINLSSTFQLSPEILTLDSQKVIVIPGEKGLVKIVDIQGKVRTQQLNIFNQAKYCFGNIQGDNQKELIALENDNLISYALEIDQIRPIFDKNLPMMQDDIFILKSRERPLSLIGTVAKSKKQIFLFNSEGELMKDFPLAGATPFTIIDLFGNNNDILIVALDNSIYTYRILIPDLQ